MINLNPQIKSIDIIYNHFDKENHLKPTQTYSNLFKPT